MKWTIIELEEDIMELNNMTKFHKILIKNIQLIESRTQYVQRTGVTLNAPARIVRESDYSALHAVKGQSVSGY